MKTHKVVINMKTNSSEVQKTDLQIAQCEICGKVEVREVGFLPEEFLSSSKNCEVSILQFTCFGTPRHAISMQDYILRDFPLHVQCGKSTKPFPQTFEGWRNWHPENGYVFLNPPLYGKVEDIKRNLFISRLNDESALLKFKDGSFLYATENLLGRIMPADKIVEKKFNHSSCLRKQQFPLAEKLWMDKKLRKSCFNDDVIDVISNEGKIYELRSGSTNYVPSEWYTADVAVAVDEGNEYKIPLLRYGWACCLLIDDYNQVVSTEFDFTDLSCRTHGISVHVLSPEYRGTLEKALIDQAVEELKVDKRPFKQVGNHLIFNYLYNKTED